MIYVIVVRSLFESSLSTFVGILQTPGPLAVDIDFIIDFNSLELVRLNLKSIEAEIAGLSRLKCSLIKF